jgi:hypothetical protein
MPNGIGTVLNFQRAENSALSHFRFGVLVWLIGATDPMPVGGYSKYTAVSALRDLFKSSPQLRGTALAER